MLAPMTEEAAAWVRENVWSASMRKEYRDTPNAVTRCACQFGPSMRCAHGEHGKCSEAGAEGLPFCEGYITDRRGYVLHLAEWFENPTLSATGAHTRNEAQVWLADRKCRWRCPCECHTKPERGALPPPKAREVTWLGEPAMQETLF